VEKANTKSRKVKPLGLDASLRGIIKKFGLGSTLRSLFRVTGQFGRL
jgi:hypothetical protein